MFYNLDVIKTKSCYNTHTNKSEIVPVLSLLVARSFNILLHKIQFFSPNFLMRKLSVNGEFQQTFQ